MKEPRCVLCNKAEEDLIPISSPLNIHACDRHWAWSWGISALLFIVGGTWASVSVLSEPSGEWRMFKGALILFAMPWMAWEFFRSLRARRTILAERAARQEASRCQGGEPIAPSRDVDRAQR